MLVYLAWDRESGRDFIEDNGSIVGEWHFDFAVNEDAEERE